MDKILEKSGRWHFVGIGGAGMAPLAALALERGLTISGSELDYNGKCAELAALGADIRRGHAAANLPEQCDLLIYSSAVPPDNPERQAAAQNGIPQLSRGACLAEFAGRFYRRTVAVSGSHGKSSITALLVNILRRNGFQPGFMIGAEVENLPSRGAGDGDIFVTEADESDGTHTLLHNFLAVVPNVEDDHAWSVGGREQLFRNFQQLAANSAQLIYGSTPFTAELFAGHPAALALELPAQYGALTGYQAANAALAAAAAVQLGVPPAAAAAAAAEYVTVKRRMTFLGERGGIVFYEDYAHHPTELQAALELLRRRYPGRQLLAVIQPHRFARLERYFTDFVRVLSLADRTFVTPVFAAWSEHGTVDGAALAAAAGGTYCPESFGEVAEKVRKAAVPPAVIAVFGAATIHELAEIFRRDCGGIGKDEEK